MTITFNKKRSYAIPATALTVTAALIYLAYGRHDPPEIPKTAIRQPSVMVFPQPEVVEPPQAVLPPSPPVPLPSKSKEFDYYAANPHPASQYAAYKLAEECEQSKALPRFVPTLKVDPEKCGDLSKDQLDNRMKQLRPAVLAGVPRAWWALRTQEGPGSIFGGSVPSDYPDLLARAYKAAVAHADPTALVAASTEAGMKGDHALALMYWVAFRQADARDRIQPFDPYTDKKITELSKDVPVEIAKKAIEDGTTYVATARSQK